MIRIRPGSFPLLFTLALVSLDSQAQLYKWVDKNGEVHFSDKAPADQASSSVVPAEQGNMVQYPAGSEKTAARPIMRPYDQIVRKLHLTDIRYSWKNASRVKESEKIGIYHIGTACTTRGAIKAPDVFIRHKAMLPEEFGLTYYITRTIKGLNYEAERTQESRLQGRLQRTGGVSLHAEITAMDFKACAASVSNSARLKPVETIPSRRFKKNRVRLRVNWQLRDNDDSDPLYETTTDGEYNGWKQSTAPGQAVSYALEAAVLNLFSQQDFIERLITDKSASLPLPSQAQAVDTVGDTNPLNAFVTRAQATNALSEISQVKIHSIQYYMSEGQWPDDLSAIGLSGSMFHDSDTIEFVSLDSDGSIIAELKQLFGAGKTITLQPKAGSNQVSWRCISNLDKAYLPYNCRQH